MKNKLCFIFVMVIIMITFSSCDTKTVSSKIESNNHSEIKTDSPVLLTKEELIQICDLSEEEYADIDLDLFIDDFHLTKDNVSYFNIHKFIS